MSEFTKIHDYIMSCFTDQTRAVTEWHTNKPEALPFPDVDVRTSNALLHLILNQHYMNYCIWHVEDTVRRKDLSTYVIAGCKHSIDRLNQQRNDFMEQVDVCLIRILTPYLPSPEANNNSKYNTESLGMAIDRLSIMALKIYHMEEQSQRTDVDFVHIKKCQDKMAILKEQRSDLIRAVSCLLDDYKTGSKQPKLYFQFKMYNDPALNPELYKQTPGTVEMKKQEKW
jgi:hypothetical protein